MSESFLLLKNVTPRSSECLVVWWSYKGANIAVYKKKKKKSLEAPQIWMGLHRNWSLKRLKVPRSTTAEPESSIQRVRLPSPERRAALFPTSLTRKQLGVPEIVRGRVSVVCVVFPVSAAVCGCGGKCLSVHLQVHQFVAWAWSVRGVAAAALGADQTQDQREEAHTWRHRTGGDMDHTSDDRKNTSTDLNLVWCRRLYMLLDIMICPTCCSLTNSGVIFWT